MLQLVGVIEIVNLEAEVYQPMRTACLTDQASLRILRTSIPMPHSGKATGAPAQVVTRGTELSPPGGENN